MQLSPGQADAANKVGAWLKDKSKPFFYLAGYAGTGKTSIARYLSGLQDKPVGFAAYTGKAASVLQKKGIPASTIHSLIYEVEPLDEDRAKELQDALQAAKTEEEQKQVREEIKELYKPKFTLRRDSPLRELGLLVVDEVSMVGEEIGQDLLSFGVPVLVLGDPGQLPPVSGEGYFTGRTPDVLLTEIHRQAAGNPIIGMATIVRQGGRLKAGRVGESEVVWKTKFNEGFYTSYDQVICGRNATRRSINSRIRDKLGYTGGAPEEGEKIICLKNNKELGILNGTQWTVDSCEDNGIYLYLGLKAEGFKAGDKPLYLDAHPFDVDFNAMPYYERRKFEEFDFGYAITCHKSQGSQWGSIIIFNESYCFRENANKWLYTALTRAEEKVMVVL